MTPAAIEAAKACVAGSQSARMTFPEVLERLAAVGIERYHADLCRHENTYYAPDGDACVVPGGHLNDAPADVFAASGVEDAIRASQRGEIDYRTFCERVAAAGCAGYLVSLHGRRAVYYGRSGETFVEPFPTLSKK